MILEISDRYTFTVRDYENEDGIKRLTGIYLGVEICIDGCKVDSWVIYREVNKREKIAFPLRDLVSARVNNETE